MRLRVLVLAVGLSIAGCKSKSTPAPSEKVLPKPPEAPKGSAEQLERKARSEKQLAKEGVKVNPALPVIADKATAKLRTKDAVVDRLLALAVVSSKGGGLSDDKVLALQKDLGAAPFLSPKESAFVALAAPDAQQRKQYALRSEDMAVLHWALGQAALEPAGVAADSNLMRSLLQDQGVASYRTIARLRPDDDLLDSADLVLRYDWACSDARANNQPAPHGLDCDIVAERLRALRWLIGDPPKPGEQADAW